MMKKISAAAKAECLLGIGDIGLGEILGRTLTKELLEKHLDNHGPMAGWRTITMTKQELEELYPRKTVKESDLLPVRGHRSVELKEGDHVPGWIMPWEQRPDMIILDDLEDPGPVQNNKRFLNNIMEEKMNEVTITKVTNGFIVKVGCMTLVSKSWKEIAGELGRYWEKPAEMQKKYEKIGRGK
jgi:hypothetical protein